ncbi:MAG: hypothetical protein ABIK68_05035, partial [bacterium]
MSDIKKNTTNFKRISGLLRRRTLYKLFLLLSISAAIGYLISPRMIFLPTVYEEGDIIMQTLVVEEDLLIPDKVSTQLKQEKLIKEQRPTYDFDPKILEQTRQNILQSFQTIRAGLKQQDDRRKDLDNKNRLLGLDYFNAVHS